MCERKGAVAIVDEVGDRLVNIERDPVLIGIGRNRVTHDRIRHRRERLQRRRIDRRGQAVLMSERERAVTIVNKTRDRLIDIERNTVLIGIGANRVTHDRARQSGQGFKRCSIDRRRYAAFCGVGKRSVAVVDERGDRFFDVEAVSVLVGVRTDEAAASQCVGNGGERLQRGDIERGGRAVLVGERDRLITVVYERRDRLVDIGRYAIFIDVRRNRIARNQLGNRRQRLQGRRVDRGGEAIFVRESKGAITIIGQRRNRLIDIEAGSILIGIGGNRVAGDRVRDGRERLECGCVESCSNPSFVCVGECLVTVVDQRRDGLVDVPNHTVLIGIGRNRVARNELGD